MKYRLIILTILFLPAISNAEVLFSEIAWMGTTENANDEWIEIYNFSSNPTDLTGWTISDGNSLNISLEGTMPPHGVFLLERTDDTTVPTIAAAVIYTGALTNSGATLTLKDSGGTVVGELIGGENWINIGGNNEYKYTAQSTRTGAWVTGIPTPGLPNIEEDTEIPDDGDEEDDEEGNEDDDNDEDDNDSGSSPEKSKKSDSSSSSSNKREQNKPLSLSIDAPTIAYVNQEISFEAIPSGAGNTTRNSLKYLWNFGDINTSSGKGPTHVFKYPGEYTVVVEAKYAKQIAQERHEIQVLQTALRITSKENGDVLLVNESSHEVDLHGFVIKGARSFSFPRLSILKAGGSITIPKEKFGANSSSLALYDTQNTLVFSSVKNNTGTVLGASRTASKVAYKAPTPAPKVANEIEESVPSAKEVGTTVIRIGDDKNVEVSERNPLARLFGKIFSFFRL